MNQILSISIKYLLSIIFQALLFIILIMFSININFDLGVIIPKVLFILLILLIISIPIFVSIKLFKSKPLIFISILLFPIILFFSYFFAKGLSQQLGFLGRSESWGYTSFPTNINPNVNNNWTYLLESRQQYRKAFWEKGDIFDLIYTITDKKNGILFNNIARINLNPIDCHSKVIWNVFDTCDIYNYNVHILNKIQLDTLDKLTPIFKMKLKYDSLSGKFIKINENWNDKYHIK